MTLDFIANSPKCKRPSQLEQLQASEHDKFAAHLYQARREFRHNSERPGKGNKAMERSVISSYQIAQSMGFKRDFRRWEDLLRSEIDHGNLVSCS